MPSNCDGFLSWQPRSCSPDNVPLLSCHWQPSVFVNEVTSCRVCLLPRCVADLHAVSEHKQAKQFFNEESSGEQSQGRINLLFLFFSTTSRFLLSLLLLLPLPSSLSSLSGFGSSSSSFLSKALSPVWAILRHQSVLPAVGISPPTDRTAERL